MTPSGARKRRGRPEFTRENALAVAADLFRERGYRATSLQEVADVFGVQRPALYYHFKNKAELLVEIHTRLLTELTQDLEEIAALDVPPETKLARLFEDQVRVYAENIAGLAVLLQNQEELPADVRKPVQEEIRRYGGLLEGIVREGIEAGALADDLDPKMVVLALSGMTGWMYRWYDPAGAWGPDEIADVFIRLAENGMLADGPARRG
jgi:AcrR family transcriptional regulator